MTCDLLQLATPGVAGLQPYQAGKPIEELERELGLKNIIKLASNENPLGPGPMVRAAMKQPLDISRYPDGNGYELKSALAEYHGIRPEQITLGNGSNDVLELSARAVVTSEHEVIFSEHAFAVYPLVTGAIGAKAVIVPARNFGHDLKAMQGAISKRSRLMFVANPNNPTGTWSTRSELRSLLEAVPEHIIVVVDEAYFDYVQEPDYPDCIEWLPEFPNLVVTRTFSKVHGLAGLRVGYSISHKDLADLMNRVRQPFNVNSMAMVAAKTALKDTTHIEQSVKLNQNGMQQLTDAFDSMGLNYIPSAGNFVCVDLQQPGKEVFQQLLHKGVIVRPIDNYGMPNHLRITIGLEEENEKFIKALKKVIGKVKREA
ncbi:MAG: histidinol-phosphate transaminase [Gammaproteobacteria bacterium]|nr:histidinol-phosphate transaminase [Gammaproteobacteria bacterium]